jgi:hypothetical protein
MGTHTQTGPSSRAGSHSVSRQPATCRCGQDLDTHSGACCPRCGTSLHLQAAA